MKIIYYTNGKSEILIIQDKEGKTIKKDRYSIGNCLIDILYGKKIICDNAIIDIDINTKYKIANLLEKCSDYLNNDINKTIESELSFIFDNKYLYQNKLVENKLEKIYYINDICTLVCLLLTHIYNRKIMYKRCAYCNNLFATRFTNARFCKRIATKSGKSCRYASKLKNMEVLNDKFINKTS